MLAQRRGGEKSITGHNGSDYGNKKFIVDAWKHHASISLNDFESKQDQYVTRKLLSVQEKQQANNIDNDDDDDSRNSNQEFLEMWRGLQYHLV